MSEQAHLEYRKQYCLKKYNWIVNFLLWDYTGNTFWVYQERQNSSQPWTNVLTLKGKVLFKWVRTP